MSTASCTAHGILLGVGRYPCLRRRRNYDLRGNPCNGTLVPRGVDAISRGVTCATKTAAAPDSRLSRRLAATFKFRLWPGPAACPSLGRDSNSIEFRAG